MLSPLWRLALLISPQSRCCSHATLSATRKAALKFVGLDVRKNGVESIIRGDTATHVQQRGQCRQNLRRNDIRTNADEECVGERGNDHPNSAKVSGFAEMISGAKFIARSLIEHQSPKRRYPRSRKAPIVWQMP